MDLISLVIGLSFGGFFLLLIVGFLLIQHRNRNPVGSSTTYENRDYYSQYGPKRAEQSRYAYQSSRRPFRSDAEIEENARRVRTNARAIMFVMIVLALAVIIVSSLFDYYFLILLIFLIPIAISFFRSSRNRNNNSERDPDNRR